MPTRSRLRQLYTSSPPEPDGWTTRERFPAGNSRTSVPGEILPSRRGQNNKSQPTVAYQSEREHPVAHPWTDQTSPAKDAARVNITSKIHNPEATSKPRYQQAQHRVTRTQEFGQIHTKCRGRQNSVRPTNSNQRRGPSGYPLGPNRNRPLQPNRNILRVRHRDPICGRQP